MNAPAFKTKAEQKLDWLQSLHRPLTDTESEDLRKALHAVYCRNRRAKHLAEQRREEIRLLKRIEREARQPDIGERV